jgi:uncharacterized linocin/CFP29 family protein
MDKLLKEIAENIPGIWVNHKYELVLSLSPQNVFSFIDKTQKSETEISGEYTIVYQSESHFPLLRVTESTGLYEDFVINELSAFGKLIITHEGEEIELKNQPPEESRYFK